MILVYIDSVVWWVLHCYLSYQPHHRALPRWSYWPIARLYRPYASNVSGPILRIILVYIDNMV